MSYCVNCGVELAPSQRACPLCGTPVQNPRQPYDPETPKPFPSELDLFSPSDDRGYLALIATLLLALPAAICLCCDLAYTHGAGWSLLVAGAMGLLWILVVPMLLIRRGRVWWALLLDTAGVLGYLWLVERFAAPGEWYWRLAVPIVLLLFFLAAADTLLLRRIVKGRLRQTAAAVITVPLLLAGIEAAVDFYLDGQVDLFWSLLVSLPCLLLALLLLVLDRRRRFKAQMRKRLHW